MTLLASPPKEWRRPSLSASAQIILLKRLVFRLAKMLVEAGVLAPLRREEVHYDHRPPLSERRFDEEAYDTVPSANDIGFLEAILYDEHDERTNGPRPGEKRITTRGSDAHNRAQTRHITEREEEFRRRVLAKDAGEAKPASRWPKRKLQSRGFERRRP